MSEELSHNSVFIPTFNWQTIHEGISIPPGLEIKLSLGEKEERIARIPNPYQLQLYVELTTSSKNDMDKLLLAGLDTHPKTSLNIVDTHGNTALIGVVNRRCKKYHGCFVRMNVLASNHIHEIKAKILHSVCDRISNTNTNGELESDPPVILCLLNLYMKTATGAGSANGFLRGSSVRINDNDKNNYIIVDDSLTSEDLFLALAENRLKANVHVSPTSDHTQV